MSRTYKVGKTREAKPKVTLYENGMVMLSRRVVSVIAGERLGTAWAGSEPKAGS